MTARELRQERYREWLEAQLVRFNFPRELTALANNISNGVQNEAPPVELWHFIVPTLRLLEKVRERFGPTTIRSGYRSPKYNAAVDGEDQSLHMANKAIDFHCATGTPEQWAEFLRDLRRQGVFAGGIGLYATFVHIDTRGANRDWQG
jgi:uncharacterized protein YcbK (DUF882 family)